MSLFNKNKKVEKNLINEGVEVNPEQILKLDPTYKKYKDEIDFLILEGEQIENVYPLIIDYICITDKRLIFVDKEISGKVEIISVPYKNICDVGITKGHAFNLTNELKIRTKGKDHELKFVKGRNVTEIYNQIIEKII